MDLRDQTQFMELFHSGCLAIVRQKNPDYAPEGIPLLDLLASCVESNIEPPQALWVLYRKHFSGIRKHFFLNKPLTSEPIMSRLQDAANYFGLLAFYETHKFELLDSWSAHWNQQPCDDPDPNLCQRCATLFWLKERRSVIAFPRTSSRSTPKVRD